MENTAPKQLAFRPTFSSATTGKHPTSLPKLNTGDAKQDGGDGPIPQLVLNPYSDIEWSKVKQHKANFHTHTIAHKVLKNGSVLYNNGEIMGADGQQLRAPVEGHERRHPHPDFVHTDGLKGGSDGGMRVDQVIDAYHQLGYTILFLTDHDRITWPWERYGRDPRELGMLAVVGNELTRKIHHTVSLFTDYAPDSEDRLELSEPLALRNAQFDDLLAGIASSGGLAIIAHPTRDWPMNFVEQQTGSVEHRDPTDGVPENVLQRYLDIFRKNPQTIGMEVLNGTRPADYPHCRSLWDQILTKLMPMRPVWGFANDDLHSPNRLGRDWNIVLTKTLGEEAVRKALETGAFFFASIRPAGSDGAVETTPAIQAIHHDAESGTLTAEATENGQPSATKAYTWIANGEPLHIGPVLNYHNIQDTVKYARLEVSGRGGIIHSNPFGFQVGE